MEKEKGDRNIDMNVKKDFPIFDILENGENLVYLDNAATTQKPSVVIDAITDYYRLSNANPHRGVYALAGVSTDIYENARKRVAEFIHAESSDCIIFTKNTTEALNLIAHSYAMNTLKEGDEILIGISEHHANLIPWQQVCKKTGAVLKYLYLNEDFTYDQEEIDLKINEKTKIISMATVSNVLGTCNPVEYLIEKAHQTGAIAIVDAAQSIAHLPTDVQRLNPDFLVFSGHKAYAPMGIGVLYGKESLLNEMIPYQVGGDMILSVYEQEATFAKAPNRFEAGTQNVEAAAGLTAALNYIDKLGLENIMNHEHELISYAMERMKEAGYLSVYGNITKPELRNGIISFNIDEVHPHDVATIMDATGVTVRAGHHCAQPLMKHLGIHSCSRMSVGIYNDKTDIDAFISAIENVRRTLGLGA